MKRILLTLSLCVVLIGSSAAQSDLANVQTYLIEKVSALRDEAERLEAATADYFTLAESAAFDYDALWGANPDAVKTALAEARDAWIVASPLYEQVEGIVAGVTSLSEFDVILDAGVSGAEDPENGVPFDLTLSDGRVLERPGNLFGVLESTLWGTRADYSSGIAADLNGNGELEFSDLLPDAQVLAAAAETLHSYTSDLVAAAEAWEPTAEDAFTALVVMTPTMSEYFASWRDSRFVSGDNSTQAEFVVISRLADVEDILSGLQVVYEGVSPMVITVDAAQDQQIRAGLLDLQVFVAELHAQELAGEVFTPEAADLFGNEAQFRAQAITGQITQAAALAGIDVSE
ncbi:MAG: imelysin family protein [Anaerolineae bacterium]